MEQLRGVSSCYEQKVLVCCEKAGCVKLWKGEVWALGSYGKGRRTSDHLLKVKVQLLLS